MTRTLARSAAALAALLAISCGGSGPSTPPDPTYTLEIRYRPSVDAMSEHDRAVLTAAVDKAAARVRLMITAGLVPVQIGGASSSCQGTAETVPINETVHGLVVLVSYDNIGTGGTLASSGPCIVRRSSRLPLVSVLQFNSNSSYMANAISTEDSAYVETVALHEMFHTLGFGTVWRYFSGLVTGTSSVDPVYRGSRALRAAKDDNHAPEIWSGLDVEAGTVQGTAGAHWRESTFDSELMTGYVAAGASPLSAMSIASLADLGYHVDTSQADVPAYMIPGSVPPALRAPAPEAVISFGDDVLLQPPVEVDDEEPVP